MVSPALLKLYFDAKKVVPKVNLSEVLAIAKIICSVADGVCPVVQGMFKSRRFFHPKLSEQALLPSQVAKAYNFPLVDPKVMQHRTAVLVELGGSFNIADVYAYCDRYGYARPTVSTIVLPGAEVQVNDADGEVCLDIDVIAAVAPGIHIVVVFAPNTEDGFLAGVKSGRSLNPDVISISWGAPEDQWTAEGRAALDAEFKLCAESGIGVYCASGDSGSRDGELGNHVDYPASSPYVCGCGGTNLQLNADGSRGSEKAWSPGLLGNGGSSGGGLSAAYQRKVPDVAGNADPATGYQVDVDGKIVQVGGTSAVAPLYAALQCLLNAVCDCHVSGLPTRFYANPSCFFDVTQGNNGGFRAGDGYDEVTGLGVIDAAKFLDVIEVKTQALEQ